MGRSDAYDTAGHAELRAALRPARPLFCAVAVFGLAANLLLLTGPLYMLQVYDRVLVSGSVETLVALSLIAVFLFAVMGMLDHARARILARVGAQVQARLARRTFGAALAREGPGGEGLRDLDAIARFLASAAPLALIDLPWTPLFLVLIVMLHPWLGALALAGAALLILLAVLHRHVTRAPHAALLQATRRADARAAEVLEAAPLVRAMGMQDAACDRWLAALDEAGSARRHGSDCSGGIAAVTRTTRLILQSAMIGLGALLVLRGALSPGVMIACSVLLGRALAPVEQAIAQWPLAQDAAAGWRGLSRLLSEAPEAPPPMALPRPTGHLSVTGLRADRPLGGQALLDGVSFALQPGQALGIIGPSGSGKSTLCRAISGAGTLSAGMVRLGGATRVQFGAADWGRHVGYLPQRVALFSGTLAQNIARMQADPDPGAVIAAARAAGAHAMILALPGGYDTPLTAEGAPLSGGQIQRIGLARALFGDPVLLILDEANASLDAEGSAALNHAIRAHKARGGVALITAQRPAAIRECDLLLRLDNGTATAFGPAEAVLRGHVVNHRQILQAAVRGQDA
ncbi:type I secretion system permease/ATPase [Pseudooceanicola sp. LIPI14-2-Ac024]|uniref:type I secretion system permease/ATPase n=1 Tax=Pseudooceanicola sp. LIPI14-2-Ac024 TaxID=3344875 RepID=UPI0035CFBFAC